jgi:hypothetical protein
MPSNSRQRNYDKAPQLTRTATIMPNGIGSDLVVIDCGDNLFSVGDLHLDSLTAVRDAGVGRVG